MLLLKLSREIAMRHNDIGFHRCIRFSWYGKFKKSAEKRGIEWKLTIDDLADLYEAQGGKCALTDDPIFMPNTGYHRDYEASIDRINSAFPYMVGNVQLTTKISNMMKQSYSQERFIEVCNKIATHTINQNKEL